MEDRICLGLARRVKATTLLPVNLYNDMCRALLPRLRLQGQAPINMLASMPNDPDISDTAFLVENFHSDHVEWLKKLSQEQLSFLEQQIAEERQQRPWRQGLSFEEYAKETSGRQFHDHLIGLQLPKLIALQQRVINERLRREHVVSHGVRSVGARTPTNAQWNRDRPQGVVGNILLEEDWVDDLVEDYDDMALDELRRA